MSTASTVPAPAPHAVRLPGKTSVSLAELIALRGRVGKASLPRFESRSARSGQQSSRLFGRGMDYAESRGYQGGDDVRRLDWRLTARSGKLHTKLFQEEREGQLLILFDTHAAMRFGTRMRFKSVQAARAAAWAAWYATKAGERVGMLGFGRVDDWVRPRAGARGALAVCGALADWDARAISDRRELLSQALQQAQRLRHGASRIVLISDGGCCDEAARRPLLELSRRARLVVLGVSDALENAPAPPGRYPLEHAGQPREVALYSASQRLGLQRALGAGQRRLAALAQSINLSYRMVDTASDPFDALGSLLGRGGAGR